MSARLMRRLAGIAFLVLASARCGPADAAAEAGARAAPLTREAGAAALRPAQPGMLRTVAGLAVVGHAGADGRSFEVARRTREVPGSHARPFGTRVLGIGLRRRAPDLTQYPCSSCHGGASAPPQVRAADVHPDIPDTHPPEAGRGCLVCHAASDVSRLALRSGETVTLDEAYRVCAQCHSRELDAWSAGAHGKRLDGWQGRRVVMGCADCHDPHQPALEARVPFRGPRLPATRSNER